MKRREGTEGDSTLFGSKGCQGGNLSLKRCQQQRQSSGGVGSGTTGLCFNLSATCGEDDGENALR